MARRLITRSIAIIPALAVILLRGPRGLTSLMVLSQVVLSFQLPFAMIPLVLFASSRRLMGEFALRRGWKVPIWAAVSLIIAFNLILILQAARVLPE